MTPPSPDIALSSIYQALHRQTSSPTADNLYLVLYDGEYIDTFILTSDDEETDNYEIVRNDQSGPDTESEQKISDETDYGGTEAELKAIDRTVDDDGYIDCKPLRDLSL